ncbi:hypothetical protein ACSBLW_09525 [Thioclava sp. FR2]|uniref:hypothetical protein n=1 Tax=Thioclava sp. FR2 TaxID=3445780 RepID=UPI003EC0FBB1
MRHDWIFEVLEDLRAYALQNGLLATATKAEEALRVARLEVGLEDEETDSLRGGAGGTPRGRPN